MSHVAQFPRAAKLAVCLALTAACADQAPTAPARVPTLAPALFATTHGGKPTQLSVPDAALTWEAPAGLACSFAVSSVPVVNRLVTKRFPADASGDMLELTTGTAIVRYTNLATGKSLLVNISGPGQFTIHPDGSATLVAVGNWSHVVTAGSDLTGGSTFFLTSGRTVYQITPGGVGTIVSRVGKLEDLCNSLA